MRNSRIEKKLAGLRAMGATKAEILEAMGQLADEGRYIDGDLVEAIYTGGLSNGKIKRGQDLEVKPIKRDANLKDAAQEILDFVPKAGEHLVGKIEKMNRVASDIRTDFAFRDILRSTHPDWKDDKK